MTRFRRHDWQWAPVEYTLGNHGIERTAFMHPRVSVSKAVTNGNKPITLPAKVICNRCGTSVTFERFNRDVSIRKQECKGVAADAH